MIFDGNVELNLRIEYISPSRVWVEHKVIVGEAPLRERLLSEEFGRLGDLVISSVVRDKAFWIEAEWVVQSRGNRADYIL